MTSEQILVVSLKGNVGEQAGHIKRKHEDIRVNVKILHGFSKGKQI